MSKLQCMPDIHIFMIDDPDLWVMYRYVQGSKVSRWESELTKLATSTTVVSSKMDRLPPEDMIPFLQLGGDTTVIYVGSVQHLDELETAFPEYFI